MILSGDIGGTNTRLALVDQDDAGRFQLATLQTYPSRRYEGLHEIVAQFLHEHPAAITAACFGVAGPVKNGRCATMNLTWVVDQRELAGTLGIAEVSVINDLEAMAYGVSCLGPQDIAVLNPGAPDAIGHSVVVSPGTGLGEAGMYWDGCNYRPIATEGGHADFAARNELEIELLRFLLKEYDHVSYERIVSGPGLVNIYRFLRDTQRGEEPPWLADELQQADSAAVISQAAMAKRAPLCERALDLFIELFGAEAGNMALNYMATGGVWLGGGIPVKILDRLKTTDLFMHAFLDKGRLRNRLLEMPVRVILNDKTGLLGAARHAVDMLAEKKPCIPEPCLVGCSS
jgi:glucokinase